MFYKSLDCLYVSLRICQLLSVHGIAKNQTQLSDWTTKINLFKLFSHFNYDILISHVWIFATPWTVAHQISLHMELPRQEYWSGSPPPGDLPNPGIEPGSPVSQADALLPEPPEEPQTMNGSIIYYHPSPLPQYTQHQRKFICCALRVISISHFHWGCIFFEFCIFEKELGPYQSLLTSWDFKVVILVPKVNQNRKFYTASACSMHHMFFSVLSPKCWHDISLIFCQLFIFH